MFKDQNRFDTITRLLASRRTRRGAVLGGLGLAATARLVQVSAQDATPAVDPNNPHPHADTAQSEPEFLFVQPFDSGAWAPKEGEAGTHTLTLAGAAAQTVYFSDRPERIVGLAPTQTFLDGLGFTPGNPPNAAVVAQREDGSGQEILVLELLNPVYDGNTLTYDARTLADYGETGLASLAKQQQDYELGETFGEGSLFIDDCPYNSIACHDRNGTFVGNVSAPMCWDPTVHICVLCHDPGIDCRAAFPGSY